MEKDVDYVKAAASLQRQTQVRGSRSWRQTDRRRNKSTSNKRGENRIAAAAAIALQTKQDLSSIPAHNIVQNFQVYTTPTSQAAPAPQRNHEDAGSCPPLEDLRNENRRREQPDTDKDQQR
jgi:hypothetical protein